VSAPEQNEIRVFHNDDAAYERFVEQFGGYVLTNGKVAATCFTRRSVDTSAATEM
jgi:hypothetical protein